MIRDRGCAGKVRRSCHFIWELMGLWVPGNSNLALMKLLLSGIVDEIRTILRYIPIVYELK